jgi:hypothetical protein
MRNFFKAVVVTWGSLFLLSGTLAFGLDRALVRGAFEHPSFDEEVAVSIVGTWHSPTLPVPTEPATRWVFLSSANHQGARTTLECLVAVDLFAADIVELDPADMDRLAASVRCYDRT